MGDLILHRRYTLVHGFCFFNLLFKELIKCKECNLKEKSLINSSSCCTASFNYMQLHFDLYLIDILVAIA